MRLLPYTDANHQRAYQFLVEEAVMLDAHRYDDWFELLADDVTYSMPVRVTIAKGFDEASVATMHHFHEDRYSLRKRVERFATKYAWAEDPPSRVRRHISNVRTFVDDTDDADDADDTDRRWLHLESAVLLFRSRGSQNDHDLVSAGRRDVLRATDAGLRLESRVITVDEAVLRTQNLAVFL